MASTRLVAALLVAATCVGAFGQPRPRVAATSLRMPADGNMHAYKVMPAFGGLFFEQPVQVVFGPGETQRAFVIERPGRVAVVSDTAAPTREVFLDITSRIGTPTPDHGLLSIAFHPRFAENGFFYAWYSIYHNGQRANRLARFRVSATNPSLADPASETPLITQTTGPGGHDGGTILFGPDGYLYLSLGDGDQNIAEVNAAHQRIDRGFFGAVIRIDVDQRPGSLAPNPHASIHAGTYTVPPDNPFVGASSFNGAAVSATAVRTEFWAVGLRNPWRMSFDPDGRLWLGDVGLMTREEINVITKGANYGWEYREGLAAGPNPGAPPASAQFIDPIWDYPQSQGASITGGFVYRGTKFADLGGNYLFTDFVSGRIWSLVDNGARPLPATQIRQIATETGITGLTLDPRTGDVLLADFDSNTIKRLASNPNANGTPLPATLADTGVFSDVATLTPAAGVLPYAPNVAFWSDHAIKSRWFAVPDATSTFGFNLNGPWTFPAGAVWVKHFDLQLRRGDSASARRVETRVLVKTGDGVYGASYRWNDAQTNATLVADDGDTQEFVVTETNGTARTQRWSFPSRNSCLVCHTERSGGVLSFNTRQLNRTAPGATENQIVALAQGGYISLAASPDFAATLPALVDTTDTTKPVELRARSYLDANCAQCHQPGGTALGAFDARAATPLSLTGLVNGPVVATAALPEDRLIVPGNEFHSMLLRRLVGEYASRMPPIASSERDTAGEELIRAWIAELARPQPPSRLLNLAARAQVGTEADVLIPGFVIAGGPKTVLVRAVGPALGQFGLSDTLAAPVLTLFDSESRIVATNAGWTSDGGALALRGAAQRVGAFALPNASADSAVLVTLTPGAYTAHTAGTNNTTGVALVEVYDADANPTASGARLINTAVRAQVGTGANVLIPGLVVSHGAAKTVLIRAVGPGLSAFGLADTLAKPVLTLFAGSESYVTNIGWNSASNAAEIRATAERVGAFPLREGGADSAMLVSLSPGAYTVQVSGADGASGVALVEVYDVP